MNRDRRSKKQALERLVLEVRELPLPELDWDRVEARLMSEVRSGSSAGARGFLGRFRAPALGLALVGVAASALLFHSTQNRAPSPAPLPALAAKPAPQIPTGSVDGDHLPPGTRVTAGGRGVVVEHAGRARWTLDPQATASVTDAGEFLTVRLENGALSASVVPNPKPETFAVEVGGTRVAVHGTAFRVAKVGDRVLVEVTDGTVAIEPTSAHSDPSFLLRRGSRGSFGLDGRTGSVEGNASAVLRDSGPKSRREIARLAKPSPQRVVPAAVTSPPVVSASASAPEPSVASPTQALPEEPSIADIEAGVSAAVALMNGCFQKRAHAPNIRVSVSTGMTLSVAGDGSVQSVTFEPPLAPEVEDCGVAGLRNLTFARSVEGSTFTRILELKR